MIIDVFKKGSAVSWVVGILPEDLSVRCKYNVVVTCATHRCTYAVCWFVAVRSFVSLKHACRLLVDCPFYSLHAVYMACQTVSYACVRPCFYVSA